MTPEELREQIQDGMTIEELADEAGVDLEAFREEMMSARQDNLRSRINDALAEGEISEDQADWLLEGLEKGYLNGPFLRSGCHGSGDFKRGSSQGGERMHGMRGGGSSTE